ncbi:phage regulatory CII family protein [Novosphingobium sp. ST904]|uniref:phage regulatory CII family protein n=1 Tax=Novosphingobium sp. ST904 TaxID=1684385 RepID=UPI0006C88989|nr:phage regulatory CII family protein [Novosphingobium sp. ST904]KPH60367.1 hypothetical protein ADT71_19855 [Novosphingobium sp. ST904]TCM40085.1 hypothetical protein EDF59_105325 [Novosphingobium sp. ST904]
MIPALGRIKRAVRTAIDSCGGVDGAGITANRGRSVAGDWNNRNKVVFPPMDCGLALDEVCLSRGDGAPILQAYAAELGHVVIRLPDVGVAAMNLNEALVDASAEFGDIAAAVREAGRDGKVCAKDCDQIMTQIDEAQASLARLRALYAVLPRGT